MPIPDRYVAKDSKGSVIVKTSDKLSALNAASRTAKQGHETTSVEDTVLNKSVEYGVYGNVTKCF